MHVFFTDVPLRARRHCARTTIPPFPTRARALDHAYGFGDGVGRPFPEAPEVWISEEDVQAHVPALTCFLNRAAHVAFRIARGDDHGLTLKWIAALGATSLLSRLLGTTGLLFLAFVSTFALPPLYVRHRAVVDDALARLEAQAASALHQAAIKVRATLLSVPNPFGGADAARKAAEDEKKKL